jgi:hypothetical protein
MNEVCGWCGQAVIGINEFDYEAGGLMISCSPEVQIELIPQVSMSFCCEGCAWAFLMAEHKLMGMGDFEARRHIVEYHGIMPAAAAGPESIAHRQRCDEIRARYYQVRGWTSSEVIEAS